MATFAKESNPMTLTQGIGTTLPLTSVRGVRIPLFTGSDSGFGIANG